MILPGTSIRWRISLVVGALLLLASASGIIMTDTMVSSTLRTDQEEKHLSLARGLASTMISPLLTDNHVRVRALLAAMKAREADVIYAFVTDSHGRLVAHTLGKTFPAALLTANPVKEGQAASIRPLDTEEGRINDIAIPLLNGAAGVLHVGVGVRRLEMELARMRFIYISTALLISLAGFAAAFFLSASIARPLERLAAYAEEVSRGNLAIKIDDPGGNDEAARLARGFNRMIGELRRIQNEIEEKNATLAFRNLILTTQQENAPDGILVFDRTGRVISHNRRFIEIWQTSRKDLTGLGDRDVLQELVATLENPDQLLGLGLSFYKEHESASRQHLVTREGRVIECYSSPMRGPYGTSYGRVIYSRDITEKHRAEEAMAREKELLEVTLASIGDGVICTDLDGRVTMMNQVAAELTGTGRKEAEGRPLSEVFRIVNEKDRSPAEDPVSRVIRDGRIQGLANHAILISANGREYRIADSASPIRAGDGTMIGVVMVFRDITMQQKMEEEMAISEKLRAIGTLAGGIAHDFNNILTGISGNLSLLRPLVDGNASAVEKIERMEQAVKRGRSLSRQLITFASGGAPAIAAGDIAAVIRESCALVTPGSKTSCRIEVADDIHPCLMDPDQISQALANLVINAIQAMPDGGEIVITAENRRIEDDPALAAGDYVHISVSDQGRGIEPDILPRIFDPYFTTKEDGSGLGLASCHAIIKNHNGRITVESEPGRGTVFHLLIPAADGHPEQVNVPDRGELPRGEGRILVVDDEETIREVLSELLGSMGYETVTCADGEEALSLVEGGERFDAAILDLTIPGGLGGHELCGLLKKRLPSLPAIASSGYSDDPVMAKPDEFGFSATLAKPFSGLDVARAVKSVLA